MGWSFPTTLGQSLTPVLTTPATPPDISRGTPPFSNNQPLPPLPPLTQPIADDRLRGLVTDPFLARRFNPQPFTRPISYPSPSRVGIDVGHILSGHQVGGSRLAPGHDKSLFPVDWNAQTIERAVREAYRTADTVLVRTGDAILLEGSARGWRIQLWYNTQTREIETAYPNRADVEGVR